jgi:predicted Rossmann-fold nucleotide-binding protein
LHPVILVNVSGFFDPLIAMLERCISEGFMGPRHAQMWRVVDRSEDVLSAIASSQPWPANARDFAVVKNRD